MEEGRPVPSHAASSRDHACDGLQGRGRFPVHGHTEGADQATRQRRVSSGHGSSRQASLCGQKEAQEVESGGAEKEDGGSGPGLGTGFADRRKVSCA